MDVETFRENHIDCFERYHGPDLPGLPYSPGDVIQEKRWKEAARLYVLAILSQRDRETD